MHDIDISIGITDLFSSVLDRASNQFNSFAEVARNTLYSVSDAVQGNIDQSVGLVAVGKATSDIGNVIEKNFQVASRAAEKFNRTLTEVRTNAVKTSSAMGLASHSTKLFTTALARTTVAPMRALKESAVSTSSAFSGLGTKIDGISSGEKSVNTVINAFDRLGKSIGGVGGLLLSIPTGLAGITIATISMASKTEGQLASLTNKLALLEAAKLNITIEKINTAPLRAVAEEVEHTAKLIQRITNMQSSKLIDSANKALSKGLDTSQISDAMKAAVGLSRIFDTSVEEQFTSVQNAIEGNFQAFEKLIPAVNAFSTNQDKLAAITLAASNGLKVMDKEASTLWGTIERARNGFANVIEYMGRMKSAADIVGMTLRDVISPAVDYLGQRLAGFGVDSSMWMEKIVRGGAWVASSFQIVSQNISSAWDLVGKTAAFVWEGIDQRAYKLFNDIGTVYAPWMAKQVFNTMATMAENTNILVDRAIGGMIRKSKAMQGTLAFMIGTGSQQAAATLASAYTMKGKSDLIQFKFEAMPETIARQMSKREKQLLDEVNKSSAKIGLMISGSFKSNFDHIQGMMKDMGDIANSIQLKQNIPKPKADPITEHINRGVDRLEVVQSRFLARGPSDDPQKQMIVLTREMHKTLQAIERKVGKDPQHVQQVPAQAMGGFRMELIE